MKKTILMTLAALGLAGMAQAETWNPLDDTRTSGFQTSNPDASAGSQAGWWFGSNRFDTHGALYLNGGKLQTGTVSEGGDFTTSGTNWGAPVAWYTFDQAINLTQEQTLNLSMTYTFTGDNNALCTIGLVGTSGAVVMGSGSYSDSGVSMGITQNTNPTSGDYSLGYAFKAGDKTSQVTDATDLGTGVAQVGTPITLDATIAWDSAENQFRLTLNCGDKTQSMLIGESVDVSRLTICADDNQGSGNGVTISDLTLSVTPEPTTATLSLLALAGLCARRRRK